MIDARNTTPQAPSSSDLFTPSADTAPIVGAEANETDETPAILRIIWKAVLLVVGISLILIGFMIMA